MAGEIGQPQYNFKIEFAGVQHGHIQRSIGSGKGKIDPCSGIFIIAGAIHGGI